MRRIFFSAALISALWAGPLGAVVLDDFNADSQNWLISGTPVTFVAGGGPLGAGDNYVACVSNGTGGSGGKQLMYNQAQWLFDFTAAGVTQIQFYARTSYATTLELRVGLEGAVVGTDRICTTGSASLPNDGLWHLLTIDVTPADFTLLSGSEGIAGILAAPTMFRILCNTAPSFQGLQIAAEIDYDQITYVASAPLTDSPSPTWTATSSPTSTPTASPSTTPSATDIDTPAGSLSPSPTDPGSPTATPTASPSATPSPSPSALPTALVFDDFGSGGANWQNGLGSLSTSNAGGGPLGPADSYLVSPSNGTGAGGGKQVMFNQAQWLFDFSAAGVTVIQFYARTSYSVSLPLYWVMAGPGGNICSSVPVTLPNDGAWHFMSINVAPSDFLLLPGSTSISATLAAPSMVRLLSNTVPSFSGQQILSEIDYDKISYNSVPPPSPTPSATFSPSATPTQTPSDSPTANGTFTATPTATESISPSPTPSPVLAPAYLRSGLGESVLAPVPAGKAQPLCIYFKSQPLSSDWVIYNTAGECVQKLSFGSESSQCWSHQGVAPGVYLARLKISTAAGSEDRVQKFVLMP